MKLTVHIAHDDLPVPEMRIAIDLVDGGRSVQVVAFAEFERRGRLGEFVDSGYFLSPNGAILDASRGPLCALKSFSDSVECAVEDGWKTITSSGQYLEFAVGLFGSCPSLEVSVGEAAAKTLELIAAERDAEIDTSLFTGCLYEHQVEAVRWMRSRCVGGRGFGLVADEMGLGKTVEVCSFLADMHAREPYLVTLIACPASVIPSWVEHLSRYVPSLDIAVVEGPQKHRAKLIGKCEHDVLVTSIGCMRRDVAAHAAFKYGLFVIDEATAVKGHSSKCRTAARRIRADRKFALSGSPAPNTVGELHGIFGCLDSGYLGSRKHFFKAFVNPIEKHGNETAARALRLLVEPHMLRRLKDVLDLPEKTEVEIPVELYPEQMDVYVELESETRDRLSRMTDEEYEASRMGMIGCITHLRQIAVSPAAVYPEYEGGAVKIDTAVSLAQRYVAEGKKVVIHTLFVRDVVDRLSDELDALGIANDRLTGEVPVASRDDVIRGFSDGEEAGVLLISDAGGMGLNLQAASVEIQLTGWFNFERTDQAADRIHRIGQQSAVRIYRIIAKGTIEERMDAIRVGKWDATGTVMRQHDRPLLKMTRSELIELLGGGGPSGPA